MQTWLSVNHTYGLIFSVWNSTKRISHMISPGERKSGSMQNWRIKKELFKKLVSELSRKCKNWQRFAVRKLRDLNSWGLMNFPDKNTVKQLTVQILELQDKVNSLSGSRDFHDPETASSSGLSHDPSHLVIVPSPRGMLCRDSRLQPDTRNLRYSPGNVSENPLAPDGPTASCPGNVYVRKSYGYTLRTCISKHRKICSESWWNRKKHSTPCNSYTEICQEVFNLDSSLSCRRSTPATLCCWTTEESGLGHALRQIPYTLNVPVLQDEVQNRSMFQFWLPFGSYALNLRSGDGPFGGRS